MLRSASVIALGAVAVAQVPPPPPPAYYPPAGGYPPNYYPGGPQYGPPQYNGPQYPTITDPANIPMYYTSQRNYLVDRPQFGAPVIGPITGIKMPGQAAHDLAKSYPMAYFPQNAAIHPPADDGHVETFYHTHDHTHLVDWQGNMQMSSYNNGHPFVLPGIANHPDVVQEHEDAFQHGHIHYHIVEGTDPCRGDDSDDDDDCGDTEDLAAILLEAAAAAPPPAVIPIGVYGAPVGVYGTSVVAGDDWIR